MLKGYNTFTDEDEPGLVLRMDFDRDGGNTIISNIQQNIRNLNEQVGILESWIPRLADSSSSGEKIREQFNEKAQQAQHLGKETNQLMKQLVDKSNNDRALRVHRERLSNEFMSVLNRLQSAQRKAAISEKESMKQVRNAALEDEDNARYQQAVDSQMQAQTQRQQSINLNEIKERQHAINQLERDITDVNQIFADLARIVHEQGDMVDSIEANVEHATIHVEQGASNVQQAVHYQQKARQKKCMLLIFLAALIFIVGLTVYLGAK